MNVLICVVKQHRLLQTNKRIIRLFHHLFLQPVLLHKVFHALTCRLHNNNLTEFVVPTEFVVFMLIKYYYYYLFFYVYLIKGNIYGLESHHGIAFIPVFILPKSIKT